MGEGGGGGGWVGGSGKQRVGEFAGTPPLLNNSVFLKVVSPGAKGPFDVH